MKLKDGEEICDKCKDRLAKYTCLGCEIRLCPGCSSLLRIQTFTTDYDIDKDKDKDERTSLQYNSFNPFLPKQKTTVGTVDWAICKDCRKGLNKKNAIEEIQGSDEMVALVNKIRKTTLASKILVGIDESEVSNEVVGVGGNNTTGLPHNLFSGYNTTSGSISSGISRKKSFFGRLKKAYNTKI